MIHSSWEYYASNGSMVQKILHCPANCCTARGFIPDHFNILINSDSRLFFIREERQAERVWHYSSETYVSGLCSFLETIGTVVKERVCDSPFISVCFSNNLAVGQDDGLTLRGFLPILRDQDFLIETKNVFFFFQCRSAVFLQSESVDPTITKPLLL